MKTPTLTNTWEPLSLSTVYEYPVPGVPLRATYLPAEEQLLVYHPALLPTPDEYLAAVARCGLEQLLPTLLPPNTLRATIWLVGYADTSRERVVHRVRSYRAVRVNLHGATDEPYLLEQLAQYGLHMLPRVQLRTAQPAGTLARYGAALHSKLYTEPRPVDALLVMPEEIVLLVGYNRSE